jgi:hypothetical protein
MKICIVNLYFGKRPDYFDLFLISCAKNPKIDFLFLIDFDIPLEVPKNVTFIKTTFKEIVSLVQSKFNFEVALKNAYKLCDFRPAFGEIFESHFKDYDWWGHCDFDMILGDLNYVFELASQSKYVKILRQGHLTLFKNETSINQVYRNDFTDIDIVKNQNGKEVHRAYPHDGVFMNYKDVFTSEKFYCFDEFWGVDRLFYMMNLPVYREPIMADIGCKFPFIKMTAHPNCFGQYFVWNRGVLVRRALFGSYENADSYPYIHLQKRKMAQHYDSIDSNSIIVINQFGFFDCTKWPQYHYFFAIFSCVPNIAQLYRYYFPRFKSRIKG